MSDTQDITLESLVGIHELSGAFNDSINEKFGEWGFGGERTVLRFTMDAVNYEAVEDPEDSYRSSLQCVRIVEAAPANQFPAVKVVAKMKDGNSDVILEINNADTGKTIIEIGTSDTDDYYPGFVGYFSPENL